MGDKLLKVFKNDNGIALPFVLLILALILVGVTMVARQGLGSLHSAKANRFSKQAQFAAEAGAADALRNIIEDESWLGPLTGVVADGQYTYSVEVTNNFSGVGSATAGNGAIVPAGFTYLLSSASRSDGAYPRSSGVLVGRGSQSALGFALGAGGNVRMQGSKAISGSIKASGDIELRGSTLIEPLNGAGRVLAGGDIRTQGNTNVDEAQDARARGAVSAQPGIRGTELVYSADTTASTLPFIADGRTDNTLLPGEEGQVLPNPNRASLLDTTAAGFVTYTSSTYAGNFDLAGGIHYFPNGVSFQGSTTFSGSGTIIVDNGNPMEFQGSTGALKVNLIALRRQDQFPSDGDPSIRFQGSTTVSGLVYAHEDIEVQGSFQLDGVMIAYRDGGGEIRTQGSTRVTLDSRVFASIPGFESWANGFGGTTSVPSGSGAISIASWQRF